eukprot:scaffold134292_cov35-Tisochrysis_lutea.AAC.1
MPILVIHRRAEPHEREDLCSTSDSPRDASAESTPSCARECRMERRVHNAERSDTENGHTEAAGGPYRECAPRGGLPRPKFARQKGSPLGRVRLQPPAGAQSEGRADGAAVCRGGHLPVSLLYSKVTKIGKEGNANESRREDKPRTLMSWGPLLIDIAGLRYT